MKPRDCFAIYNAIRRMVMLMANNPSGLPYILASPNPP